MSANMQPADKQANKAKQDSFKKETLIKVTKKVTLIYSSLRPILLASKRQVETVL